MTRSLKSRLVPGLRGCVGLSLLAHGLALVLSGAVAGLPEVDFERHPQSVEVTFIPTVRPAPQPPVAPALPPEPQPEVLAARDAPALPVPKPPEPRPPPPEPRPKPVEVEDVPPRPAVEQVIEQVKEATAAAPDTVVQALRPDTMHGPAKAGVDDRSTLPVPSYFPSPRYPAEARREGREGLVLVTITIDRRGRVVSARLAKGSGHDDLDERALSTVRRWHFRTSGPTPILVFDYPIEFKLQ